MADKKITELTAATSISGADILALVQGGSTKQITWTNLLAAVYSTAIADPGVNTLLATEKAVRDIVDDVTDGTLSHFNSTNDATIFRLGPSGGGGIDIKVKTGTATPVSGGTYDPGDLSAATDIILGWFMYFDGAITLDTGVKIGLGDGGDPDRYGKSSALTDGLATSVLLPTGVTAINDHDDTFFYTTDSGGSAAGNFAAGNTGALNYIIIYATTADMVAGL